MFEETSAVFGGADAEYRYRLVRRWSNAPAVNWVMLNPSTADADHDDPTIRRCVGFAHRWGYGGIVVTNLFALRTPDPAQLLAAAEPIGPDNDAYIEGAARECRDVLCAWGQHGAHRKRALHVTQLLNRAGARLLCLKLTNSMQPGHPLYLRGDLKPMAYAGVRS